MESSEIIDILKTSISISDASRKIFNNDNSTFRNKTKRLYAEFKIDIPIQKIKPKIENCLYCGKPLTGNSQSKFCSHSCSASYNNKLREKDTKHNFIKNSNKPKKVYVCKVCGKEYNYIPHVNTKVCCCQECSNEIATNRKKYLSSDTLIKLSECGRKAVETQKESRRSKNEKYFCELCEKEFSNVLHNEPMFNGWDSDVILPDIKIAVLWNGAWHYKQISKSVSLEQIQNRDKIKLSEIEKCGYRPYIIKDMGKYNKSFVEEEFKKFKLFIKNSI